MKKYPSYKSTGIEWIGEIPTNWELTKPKYKTTTAVRYGLNISADKYREEGIVFIRITDLNDNGELILSDLKYLDPTDVPEDFLLEKNDILLCRSGHTVGKSYLHLFDGKFTSGGYLVRFNFGSIIFPRFFNYYTKAGNYWDWIRINTIISTIENVNGDKYSNMEFPFPSQVEQENIVAFIDQKTSIIDDLIQRKFRKIELLKEQRTSIINQAVTKGLKPEVKMKDSRVEWIDKIPEHWMKTRIDFMCNLFGRLGWKSLKAEEYVDDGFIFLSTPNIKSRSIDFENVNYITEERYLESPEIMLEIGVVLLVKDGSTLGIVNVVRNLPRPATVNSSIGVLKIRSDNLVSEFLYYFLSSHFMQNIIERIKGGMGVPHLFQADIKKFPVLLPPIIEQNQIVSFLDIKTSEIDKQVDLETRKIDLLKEFRQSLISEVVTGKIDVRTN